MAQYYLNKYTIPNSLATPLKLWPASDCSKLSHKIFLQLVCHFYHLAYNLFQMFMPLKAPYQLKSAKSTVASLVNIKAEAHS